MNNKTMFGMNGSKPIKLKPKQKSSAYYELLTLLLGRPKGSIKSELSKMKLSSTSAEDIAEYIKSNYSKKMVRIT